MPEPVFVIRNQHGLYLTRQNEWVEGYDPAPLFKTPFRDVALNTLIELNAKDIELRGVITEVQVNEKGLPQVTPADAVIPSPLDGDSTGDKAAVTAADVGNVDTPATETGEEPAAAEDLNEAELARRQSVAQRKSEESATEEHAEETASPDDVG